MPTIAAERLTNGAFTAGNTGFTSTYTYQTYDAVAGTYWLPSNAQAICGCFASLADHTTGDGLLMVVDGATTGADFYRSSFGVVANSVYTLSYWAAQLGGGPQATVAAFVNGVQVGAGFTPGGTNWENYTVSFNSGAATSFAFSLRDLATDISYNDFAVDDVSITGAVPAGGVPEPATWALMIGGFGLTGVTLRRRNRHLARVAA